MLQVFFEHSSVGLGSITSLQVFAEIAEKYGVLRMHIALAWLFQKVPATAPIIGATKISQMEDAIGALAVNLTQEIVAYLEEPYVPHRIVGHP